MGESNTTIQPATQGQLKEIYKVSLDGIPQDLSFASAKNILQPEFLTKLKELYNSYIVPSDVNPRKKSQILKLISNNEKLLINATDGSGTIAKAKETFIARIDSNFKSWGTNVSSNATSETSASVYEMKKDATFAQMFGSLSDDLDTLCLTQSQIINFCTKYPNWLRQDGYGTFFLFKVNEQYFVADVGVDFNGLHVIVHGLGDDGVWYASYQHHVVTPQQTVSL